MGQNAHAGSNAQAFYINIHKVNGVKVLLKQVYQSVGNLINRHFEEVHLLIAFCHEFKLLVQLSVNCLNIFLQFILLRERNTVRRSVCKIKSQRCLLGRQTS